MNDILKAMDAWPDIFGYSEEGDALRELNWTKDEQGNYSCDCGADTLLVAGNEYSCATCGKTLQRLKGGRG